VVAQKVGLRYANPTYMTIKLVIFYLKKRTISK